jgi:type VI protein secretion system component Hcp
MADTPPELLMMFLNPSKQALAASSTSTLTSGDTLAANFTAGQFFQIKEFGLGIELKDDEGTKDTAKAKTTADPKSGTSEPDIETLPTTGSRRSFSRYRSVQPGQSTPDLPYRIKPEACSFSREIDEASPSLFEFCAKRVRLGGAVIIKRGLVGGDAGWVTFLRLEFVNVLLTNMNWGDSTLVSESGSFTFTDMLVQYVQRKTDGTVQGSTLSCEWHKDPNKKQYLFK